MKILNFFRIPEAKSVQNLDPESVSVIHKRIILHKPFLKRLYIDFYRQFHDLGLTGTRSGTYIEIGSGGGFIKQIIRDVITTDIVLNSGVDLVFAAQQMPFKSNSVDSFFMLNVFHHIPDIKRFLREVERCLKCGGRLMMIEPANTTFSRFIYMKFHHEPFDQHGNWYFKSRNPLFSANGALPWIVFQRDRERFEREFPALKIIKYNLHTPLRYLLSGGLSYRQLLPGFSYSLIKGVEGLTSWLNHYIGMFLTVVLQKQS